LKRKEVTEGENEKNSSLRPERIKTNIEKMEI
jgi:hypothetical protein